jgi:hypothetical protein
MNKGHLKKFTVLNTENDIVMLEDEWNSSKCLSIRHYYYFVSLLLTLAGIYVLSTSFI